MLGSGVSRQALIGHGGHINGVAARNGGHINGVAARNGGHMNGVSKNGVPTSGIERNMAINNNNAQHGQLNGVYVGSGQTDGVSRDGHYLSSPPVKMRSDPQVCAL